MKFEDAFRFEIGDVVMAKATKSMRGSLLPQPLQIVERVLQQCYGGFQGRYLVRAHALDIKSGGTAFHSELFSLTEPEVESYDSGDMRVGIRP